MKMQFESLRKAGRHWLVGLAVVTSLFSLNQVQAQPTIVSTVPVDGSTGISTTAAVVFTFSEAMDPTNSDAIFYDESHFALLSATAAWSVGNTVLTCTPSPAFPTNTEILWVVDAENPDGVQLGGLPEGTYMTSTAGGGGGGGGSGTNKYTGFTVGTANFYDQTSAGAPTPDTNEPYLFLADVTLSSNRTAMSATVKLPSGSVSNLTHSPFAPEQFIFGAEDTNETTLDATFGNGDYLFTVVAADSNQQVTVTLPSSLAIPNAPHVANYAATQDVDPSQPFTLDWDAFTGGTAKDFIVVDIAGDYMTAQLGDSNALPGTATSVQIPAGVLQSNATYMATVGFFHGNVVTNKSSWVTAAIRESITQFSLITIGGGGTGPPPTAPVLTNASWSGHAFNFSVMSAANQNVTVLYTTNIGLSFSLWQTLITTNSPTGMIQVSDSVNTGNKAVYYRAQSGP